MAAVAGEAWFTGVSGLIPKVTNPRMVKPWKTGLSIVGGWLRTHRNQASYDFGGPFLDFGEALLGEVVGIE